ncbi:MAG TPA: hypothetical protein VHV55_26700 [Pirellulales bacterium]|jgi:hypothetical protein|nr:hypothetical protein [Pirellulales bacterium]
MTPIAFEADPKLVAIVSSPGNYARWMLWRVVPVCAMFAIMDPDREQGINLAAMLACVLCQAPYYRLGRAAAQAWRQQHPPAGPTWAFRLGRLCAKAFPSA